MIFVGSLFLYVHWSMVSEGVPQIEAAVRREAVSLARTNDILQSLELGRATRTRTVGSGIEMTGYFQFEGSYSNESWDVLVMWRTADTNAPIDKIELHCTSQEPKIIWSRASFGQPRS